MLGLIFTIKVNMPNLIWISHGLEVEYTHHPGEDWGGFGWRVAPSIEIHKVVGATQEIDEDLLKNQIYDSRHR